MTVQNEPRFASHEDLNAAKAAATAALLAEVDTMADWLYGECAGCRLVRFGFDTETPEGHPLGVNLKSLGAPELVALVFSADPEKRAEAAWVLRERYLESCEKRHEYMTQDILEKRGLV